MLIRRYLAAKGSLASSILEAHQLAPHRIRTFKLSTDLKFAEKLSQRAAEQVAACREAAGHYASRL